MNIENARENGIIDNGHARNREVQAFTAEETGKMLNKMKNGKAIAPDNIPVEARKHLGECGVTFLTNLFSEIVEMEQMPDEWRRSTLIHIYENNGGIQCCGNYRALSFEDLGTADRQTCT